MHLIDGMSLNWIDGFFFNSQAEELSVHRLQEEYQSIISDLRSKPFYSKAPPPVLNLDISFPSRESPHGAALATEFPGRLPDPNDPSSATGSQGAGSFLAALVGVANKFRSLDGMATGGGTPKRESSSGLSTDGSSAGKGQEVTSEDPTDVWTRPGTQFPLPVQSTTVIQTEEELIATTSDPRATTLRTPTANVHRRRRGLLHKRQLAGASMCPFNSVIVHRWFCVV